MRNVGVKFLLGIMVLALLSLACRASLELPWQIGPEDINIKPEDVSAAATAAAVAAATAAVFAQQAGQVAETAVAQGGDLLATVQVFPTALPGGAVVPPADSALLQKIANTQPDAGGNYVVTVTDAEFNEYLDSQIATGQPQALPVENLDVHFTGGQVQLTGQVTDPLPAPLVANFQPIIQNGRLQLELVNATVGGFPVPETMLQPVEATANERIAQAMQHLPAGVVLDQVAVGEGSMTVSGRGS
jgi:hypothetical protein